MDVLFPQHLRRHLLTDWLFVNKFTLRKVAQLQLKESGITTPEEDGPARQIICRGIHMILGILHFYVLGLGLKFRMGFILDLEFISPSKQTMIRIDIFY